MKLRTATWWHALIVVALVVSSCASTEADSISTTSSEQSTTSLESTQPSTESTIVEHAAIDQPIPNEAGFPIEETKTTLLVYLGDARASRDGGESWFYAESGLWLDSGDRIQIASGGIAMILLPDGTLIRLEGFADFELVLCEFDFNTGTKRIIGRVREGAALVSTIPLSTADSLFQLWSMTTFVDLPYDQQHAVPLAEADTVPEEERLVFGAVMREIVDGEMLVSFPGPVSPMFYALEMIDGEVILVATNPLEDQATEYTLPFRVSIEDEFALEGLLDTVASLVDRNRSAPSVEDLEFYGYSMVEEGSLADNQVLFTVFDIQDLDEVIAEAADPIERQTYADYVNRYPAYQRHKLHYRYFKRIPDIFSTEILMQISRDGLGCDITTGLGCGIPSGCNQETGEGCAFSSGCNIITRDGCKQPYLSCIAYTNCDVAPCGVRPTVTHFCRPRIKTYCDPRVAGDCDRYLATPDSAEPTDSGAATEPPGGEAAVERVDDPTAAGETLFDFFLPSSIPVELAQDPEQAGQPLMEPNDPAVCAPFVNNGFWSEQVQVASGGFGDTGFDDEGDNEWCTCRAKVPPGWPPPPPWMDMTYRCFCSDPGASG